jgi:neutral ceramidase
LQGYANPSQIAGGIHTRLYARAIIVADSLHPNNRTVFVNLDACMAAQAVTFSVIKNLKLRYGPDLYTEQNVALSGTHTHSGPAGYLQYLVYDITGFGFIRETFDALVDGIERAIVRAHDDVKPNGKLFIATGELLEANINRSPTAYMENPEEERAKYQYNIDKEMTVLAAEDSSGTPLGAFSWFPVHGTSMNNTNRLVNGDNKGAAAQQMERWAAKNLNQSNFVAAFCQANVGDTSPNTRGPICMDTGEPCDAVHSTCGGKVEQCIGRGPAWPNHMESTRIIGDKQSNKMKELLGFPSFSSGHGSRGEGKGDFIDDASKISTSGSGSDEMKASITSSNSSKIYLSGPIESRHIFLDMRNIQITKSPFTPRGGHTCTPAMGFAFAAGTTDGPGAFDFRQSDTNGTLFWRLVRDFIHTPTKEQEECHFPKPILLDVGEMHYPYEWVPYIVEIQIIRVGQLVILAVPGEFTTMAGRRLKEAVRDVVGQAWGGGSGSSGGNSNFETHDENNDSDVHIVIAGLSNTYSSYITTFEEYSAQRYEGGFTLFGPHTLDAYIQEFRNLAEAMVNEKSTPPGPSPPDQLAKQWSLVPGVVADGVPNGVDFGDPVNDVEESAKFTPGEQVKVVFQSACPRNDIRAEGTYLTVERKISDKEEENGGMCAAMKWIFSKLASLFSFSFSSQQNLATLKNLKNNDSDWEVVHTDADWETTFSWDRHHTFSTQSFATVTWNISSDVVPGVYRIRHFGNYKHFLGTVFPFEGSSSEFDVVVGNSGAFSSKEKKKRASGRNVFVKIITALGRRAGAFRA